MKALEDVIKMIDSLPNGTQKDYFKDIVNRINQGESLTALDVINGIDNKDFDVNIEALREKEAKANNIMKQWGIR